MEIYKICKLLCPNCLDEWNEEIEMLGKNDTALVYCQNCGKIVDGIIIREYDNTP